MGTGVSPRRITTGNLKSLLLLEISIPSYNFCKIFQVRLKTPYVLGKSPLGFTLLRVPSFRFLASLTFKQQFNPYFFFPRKEVIQPHLPIRLPCYDFTPVIRPAFGGSSLSVRSPTSGISNSHGVTGGVYKTRERIHRSILICDY